MKNSRIFALALCGICLLGGCGSRNGEEREKEFWCRPLGKEGAGTLIGIQPYGVNKADSDFMYSLWMMDVKQTSRTTQLTAQMVQPTARTAQTTARTVQPTARRKMRWS